VATGHAYRTTTARRVVTLRIAVKTAAYGARTARAGPDGRADAAGHAARRGDVEDDGRIAVATLNADWSDDWPIRLTERR
jgi:hypothetical protein